MSDILFFNIEKDIGFWIDSSEQTSEETVEQILHDLRNHA
jgi:hypothetical protein